tara:strand:+ start:44 stop:394 length:351 start_codon:yes stop_codon:yes gene_type:complete
MMLSGPILYEEDIVGEISTRSSSKYTEWSNVLRQRLQYAPSLHDRFLSIEIESWFNRKRIEALHRNDVDNIAKPVMDQMKPLGIITDDSLFYHLSSAKFGTDGEEKMTIRIREWVC